MSSFSVPTSRKPKTEQSQLWHLRKEFCDFTLSEAALHVTFFSGSPHPSTTPTPRQVAAQRILSLVIVFAFLGLMLPINRLSVSSAFFNKPRNQRGESKVALMNLPDN